MSCFLCPFRYGCAMANVRFVGGPLHGCVYTDSQTRYVLRNYDGLSAYEFNGVDTYYWTGSETVHIRPKVDETTTR